MARKEHCPCQPGQPTSPPWAPAEGNELMVSHSQRSKPDSDLVSLDSQLARKPSDDKSH